MRDLLFMRATLQVDAYCLVDRVQQLLGTCRLDQVVNRPSLDCVDAGIDIVTAREEDDRRQRTFDVQCFEQVHSAWTWHCNIQEHTARLVHWIGEQEFTRAPISLSYVPVGGQHSEQADAETVVVLDNVDRSA